MDLDRDVTLVVIQHDHHIPPACDSLVEHGVRRNRAVCVDAKRLCILDSGTDVRDLLVADHPVLAAVRVERRHGDPGVFKAPLLERLVRELCRHQDVLARRVLRSAFERSMSAQVHATQIPGYQHRGDVVRAGHPLEHLLVPHVR